MVILDSDTCYKNEINGEWLRMSVGYIFHYFEKVAMALRRWLASERWEDASPAEVCGKHFRQKKQLPGLKQAWYFKEQKEGCVAAAAGA